MPLRNLTAAEGRTLEALGDTLLPGARLAGIAHYVDDRLARPEPLLMLKFLDFRAAHDFGSDDIRCFEAGMTQGKQIMKGAGAYDVWASGRVRMRLVGGVIMGRDPKASVTNSFGQAHDVPNLFIAGPSLFPTTGGVNPPSPSAPSPPAQPITWCVTGPRSHDLCGSLPSLFRMRIGSSGRRI